MLDSFFEYLLKAYILFGEDEYLTMFRMANDAIKKHILVASDMLFQVVDMNQGYRTAYWVDSLSAFYPGLLVLSGDVQTAQNSVYLFFVLWRKYGGIPERFDFSSGTPNLYYYPLRPELVESIYYLYQATKNRYYLSMAGSMLDWLEKECRSKCGYASVQNVVTNELDDRMESFFLAETLKYFYLLFDRGKERKEGFTGR
jgi:mannosidase alpha-like ER degradation enhancer 1